MASGPTRIQRDNASPAPWPPKHLSPVPPSPSPTSMPTSPQRRRNPSSKTNSPSHLQNPQIELSHGPDLTNHHPTHSCKPSNAPSTTFPPSNPSPSPTTPQPISCSHSAKTSSTAPSSTKPTPLEPAPPPPNGAATSTGLGAKSVPKKAPAALVSATRNRPCYVAEVWLTVPNRGT